MSRRTTYGGTKEEDVYHKTEIETQRTKQALAEGKIRIDAALKKLSVTTSRCSPTSSYSRYNDGPLQFNLLPKPQNIKPDELSRRTERNLARQLAQTQGSTLIADSPEVADLLAEAAGHTGRGKNRGAKKIKYKDHVSELFNAGNCSDDGPVRSTNLDTYNNSKAMQEELGLMSSKHNMFFHRKKNEYTEYNEELAISNRRGKR